MAMLWAREQQLSQPLPTLELVPKGALRVTTEIAPQNPPSPRSFFERTKKPRSLSQFRKARKVHRETGPLSRQVRCQQRGQQGHRLRGRAGLEYALKTEFEMNGEIQCLFHLSAGEPPEEEGGGGGGGESGGGGPNNSWQRLRFMRRSPVRGWDAQPYEYLIELALPKLKRLMTQPMMSAMSFYVDKFAPNPQVQSTVLSRKKANAGSRSDITESRRLEGELAKLMKFQRTKPRLDAFKLFESSTTGGPLKNGGGVGHTLCMSTLKGTGN